MEPSELFFFSFPFEAVLLPEEGPVTTVEGGGGGVEGGGRGRLFFLFETGAEVDRVGITELPGPVDPYATPDPPGTGACAPLGALVPLGPAATSVSGEFVGAY